MQFINFSLQNLWRKPKDAAFFAFSIFITTAIITVFFAMINNPYFVGESVAKVSINGVNEGLLQSENAMIFGSFDTLDLGIGQGSFTLILTIFIIAICITTIFFANRFFLLSKAEDIGIMMASGCNIMRISKFLIYQNMVMVVFVAPFGALFGVLLHPAVNYVVYAFMEIDAALFVLEMDTIFNALMTLGIVCVWLMLIDTGFVYRSDSIIELLQAQDKMKVKKRKPWYFNFGYIAIYVGGISVMASFPVENVNVIYMFYLGAFVFLGAANIFRHTLPWFVSFIQKKFFLANKWRLLSLANLQYSIVTAHQLIAIILITTSILFYYLCKFYDDQATFIVTLFAYLVILILICVCMIYKLSVDAIRKEAVFQKMRYIGYLKSDIKRIIHQEIVGYFMFIFLIALPGLLAIMSAYVNASQIPVAFGLNIIVSFSVALILSALLTNLIYQKLILSK